MIGMIVTQTTRQSQQSLTPRVFELPKSTSHRRLFSDKPKNPENIWNFFLFIDEFIGID